MPVNVQGSIRTRSSLERLNISVALGMIEHDYNGDIYATLTNKSNNPIVITRQRTIVCQLAFETLPNTWMIPVKYLKPVLAKKRAEV